MAGFGNLVIMWFVGELMRRVADRNRGFRRWGEYNFVRILGTDINRVESLGMAMYCSVIGLIPAGVFVVHSLLGVSQ